MFEVEIFNALAGLITALGTVTVFKFNSAQAMKHRAELLEMLNKAIATNDKHATTEIFLMLHKLRMSFSDIKAICEDNNSSKIIRILQTNFGAVTYLDSQLQYRSMLKKPKVRKFATAVTRFGALLMGLVTAVLIFLMTITEGKVAVSLLIFAVPFSAVLALQLWDLRQDKLIGEMIEGQAQKGYPPI
ncbi:MAG: hypothetical protein IPM37_10835 [Hahellaceae bacterium]|nr:hypothetical protein [Hahellaceae bacterium]